MENDLKTQINNAYFDAERIKQARQIQEEVRRTQMGISKGIKAIKPCPYLLPCESCDKRNGELCSQYK